MATVVVLFLTLLAVRALEQNNAAKAMAITSPKGVQSLEKVRLGGVDQWILIRGQDISKPVLLFLHGGPGVPEMPFSRRNAELASDFVVVQWDQRGAGKSYHNGIPRESMTIGQFVEDTHELVEYLRARFHAPKIYLAAISWGTIPGAQAVSKWPDLFYAYIAVGQVTNVTQIEKALCDQAFQAAAGAGGPGAVTELRGIGPTPWEHPQECARVCKWLGHFRPAGPPSTFDLIQLAWSSPFYSLSDLRKIRQGMAFSIGCLWKELAAFDLEKYVSQISVPVYILQSRRDYVVSASLPEQFFHRLKAKRGKQLIWFENSGHLLHIGEAERFRSILVQQVLRETYR